MLDIFDYTDYRPYLNDRLGGEGKRTGIKMAAAKAIGCHTTYLSQVLSGRSELSLEQADLLNSFLAHTRDEADYLMLLVSRQRAGTESLKQRFQDQIESLFARRLQIKNRISPKGEVSAEDQARFYSSWHYGACHVLASIPDYQTRSALADRIGLSVNQVTDILAFLEKLGMISQTGQRFQHSNQHIHLGSDSGNITKHHMNWRLRALQSLERPTSQDLHYSAAVSLSRKDVQKVKDSLIENLNKNLKTIGSSKEEKAYVYCFDFFEM